MVLGLSFLQHDIIQLNFFLKMQPHQNQSPQILRIITIGDSSVGKTCFLICASGGGFAGTTDPTVGFEFKQTTTDIDSKEIKVQI